MMKRRRTKKVLGPGTEKKSTSQKDNEDKIKMGHIILATVSLV